MSNDDKLVAVYRANGEMQAQIVKGRLEADGIPCLLRSQAAPSVHAFVVDGMGEVILMVPESYAAEARRMIAEEAPETDAENTQDTDVEND